MSALSPTEIERGRTNDEIGTELVYESDAMRIWHSRLPPGTELPPHRHDRPYVWTILTDGKAVSRYDDGHEATIDYRAGMTGDFPTLTPATGFIHDLTNTGDTELIFVTIEFNTRQGEHS